MVIILIRLHVNHVKHFFRRNALRTDGKFKCRANDGKCAVTVTTRKRCKACRLAKCFEKGMRADWILTEEERMNKKRKIEENRRLRQMLYPDSSDSDESLCIEPKTEPLENNDTKFDSFLITIPLSSGDLTKIEEIQQLYTESVRLTSLPPEVPSYPYRARINAPWVMMNLPTNLYATRLITFYKLLPEFSSLNEQDKLILIKYNTLPLLFIRAALNYDPVADIYHERGTDDCVFPGKDLIQCFSLHQYERSTRCVCRILNASQNDRILIQILLIIMLFSKGSSLCTYLDEAEPVAGDVLSIYNAQNIFIDLLWKYCENKFGFTKTIDIWLKLITASLDAHLQSYNVRHLYVKNDVVADQLVPLMKSVMLIA